MFAILPAELVDDALEVVDSGIGIIVLYGRLVKLVDEIFVIFGRTLLDHRFGMTTFDRSFRRARFGIEVWGM